MRRVARSIGGCVIGGWCAVASAQVDGDPLHRLERQLEQQHDEQLEQFRRDASLTERLYLDYGGAVRFTIASIDDDGSDDHILRQSDARLHLHAAVDEVHELFVRLRLRYDDWNTGDDFDGRGDEFQQPIEDRFWYSFDGLDGRSSVPLKTTVGRQYIHVGSGLALSQTLYAAEAVFELGDWDFSALYGITPRRTVDFDRSRPGFDRHTERQFYGAQVRAHTSHAHRPYAFVLVQRDLNSRDEATFIDQTSLTFPTEFDYDSEYIGLGIEGDLGSATTYETEVVYERGRALSSPIASDGSVVAQTKEDIEAFAVSALVRHTWDAQRARSFAIQAMAGSGDGDRRDAADTFGGNRSGSTDRAFNSLGFVDTGLALAPDLANLFALRLSVGSQVLDQGELGDLEPIHVEVSGYVFGKIDPDHALSIATDDDRLVGGELDLRVDWNLLSDLSLGLRYGLFFPGPAMPRGQDGTRQIALLGVTYAF